MMHVIMLVQTMMQVTMLTHAMMQATNDSDIRDINDLFVLV